MCLKTSLKRAGNKHVFLLKWVLKSQLDPSHNSAVSYLVLVGFTHWEEEEMFFQNRKMKLYPRTHNWQANKGKREILKILFTAI